MDGRNAIFRYFEHQRTVDELYRGYLERGVNTTLDPNDKEFSAEENLDHYFSVGADALRLVISTLVENLREPPKLILDFPSGSGRVTRHLRAFFPDAKIVACDLYDYHVDFCVRELGTEGMISQENLDEVDFGQRFDLIFCCSLLTHLPEDRFRSAIRLLSRSLTDTGIAIVTLHGRHSEYIQKNRFKYLADDLFVVAESAMRETGFGYVDYDHGFRSTFFNKNARYGISLSRPHWTLKVLEDDYTLSVINYTERAVDNHQDALVFGKPGINDY
jgi:SAM-dependent methyltransferase